MTNLRAVVRNGRLTLDLPTTLPEGTTLDLVLDDEDDDPTPAERKKVDAVIAKGLISAGVGRLRRADELIRDLRARR
ncbi:MAG: hypothetical protein HYY18_11050 [Planctomycetes bacterium]|nr:hypothetical protein [Planctomycetota bacterium]